MKLNHLTPAAMARQIGISRQLIWLILSGQRPGLVTAAKWELATCGFVRVLDWLEP